MIHHSLKYSTFEDCLDRLKCKQGTKRKRTSSDADKKWNFSATFILLNDIRVLSIHNIRENLSLLTLMSFFLSCWLVCMHYLCHDESSDTILALLFQTMERKLFSISNIEFTCEQTEN